MLKDTAKAGSPWTMRVADMHVYGRHAYLQLRKNAGALNVWFMLEIKRAGAHDERVLKRIMILAVSLLMSKPSGYPKRVAHLQDKATPVNIRIPPEQSTPCLLCTPSRQWAIHACMAGCFLSQPSLERGKPFQKHNQAQLQDTKGPPDPRQALSD
eukprot:1156248-Pelagomonas_calceolata.AAC.15